MKSSKNHTESGVCSFVHNDSIALYNVGHCHKIMKPHAEVYISMEWWAIADLNYSLGHLKHLQ